ncbi:hypothetical protein [Spirosoma pulveris]
MPYRQDGPACLTRYSAISRTPGQFRLFPDDAGQDSQPIQTPPQQAQRKRDPNHELYDKNSMIHGFFKV